MRIILVLAMTLFTTLSFACGGRPLTDKEVRSNELIAEWKNTFEEAVGESLTLKEIILAGNDIYDLNMRSVVRAMCSANYIFAYFRNSDSSVVCMMDLEGGPYGLRFMKDSREKGSCRLANGSITSFK